MRPTTTSCWAAPAIPSPTSIPTSSCATRGATSRLLSFGGHARTDAALPAGAGFQLRHGDLRFLVAGRRGRRPAGPRLRQHRLGQPWRPARSGSRPSAFPPPSAAPPKAVNNTLLGGQMPAGSYIASTGDFNGDGTMDLLLLLPTGEQTIWYTGYFQGGAPYQPRPTTLPAQPGYTSALSACRRRPLLLRQWLLLEIVWRCSTFPRPWGRARQSPSGPWYPTNASTDHPRADHGGAGEPGR